MHDEEDGREDQCGHDLRRQQRAPRVREADVLEPEVVGVEAREAAQAQQQDDEHDRADDQPRPQAERTSTALDRRNSHRGDSTSRLRAAGRARTWRVRTNCAPAYFPSRQTRRREEALAAGMGRRERLPGRELLALHRRLERVVVAVGAATFLERDPPQHRVVGNRVVDAARPRRREHLAERLARATGSSIRGSGRRCARRARRCRPRRPSRWRDTSRSRSGSATASADARRRDRRRAASARAPAAARPAPYARSTASRSTFTQRGRGRRRRRPAPAASWGGPCGGGRSRAGRSGRPGRGAWPASATHGSSGSIALARRVRHSSA